MSNKSCFGLSWKSPEKKKSNFQTNVNVFKHIRMISEVSCDTEDWNNPALPSQEYIYILKYIKIEKKFF